MAYSSRLEIIIDSRSAEQQARDTEQALEALEDAGIRASRAADRVGDESKGAARDMRKLESRSKGVSSELNSMRLAAAGAFAAIGAFATSQLIGGVIRASDGLSEMQGQLRLVEGSAEAAAESYAELLEVSNETRSAMDSTVTLYTKLKRGTDQLNLSNQQLFDLTAAINNSFIVSGASAQEAANAIRQLSQGLAAGALRGEEYNAIAENSPRLTRALAESLDMTIGELREFAAEGGITSRVIADSLLSQVEALNDEAEMMPRTIGQAMTQFTNDVNNAVARADMSPFIDALDDLRAIVTDPGFQQAMVTLASSIATLVGLAAEGSREFVTLGNQLGTLAAKAMGASNELQDIDDKIMRLESMRGGSFLARGGLFDFGEGLDTYISDEDIDRYIASLKARRDEIVGEVNGNGNTGVIELPPMTITPPDPAETEKAVKAAIKEMEQAMKAFNALRAEFDPLGAAITQFNDQVAQLDSLLTAGKISAEDYGDAVRYLSDRLQGAAVDASPTLKMLKDINEQYVKANSLSSLFAQQQAAQGMSGPAGNIAQQGIGTAINDQVMGGKPAVQGLDPLYSGPFGELQRIQQEREALSLWYAEKIQMYEQYRALETEKAAQYNDIIRQLERSRAQDVVQIQQQEQMARTAGYASMFGNLANLSATFAGDSAGITRGLMAFQQAANLATTISNMAVAQSQAGASLPFPANLAAMATVAAQGAALISTIGSIVSPPEPSFSASSYSGMYDKGGMIPKGKWGIAGEYGPEIIQGPARVTSRKDTAKQLGGDTSITYAPVFQVQAQPGATEQDGQRFAKGLDSFVKSSFYKLIEKESRPGGALSKR